MDWLYDGGERLYCVWAHLYDYKYCGIFIYLKCPDYVQHQVVDVDGGPGDEEHGTDCEQCPGGSLAPGNSSFTVCGGNISASKAMLLWKNPTYPKKRNKL